GGDFAVTGQDDLRQSLIDAYPFLSELWANRLIRAYGTEAFDMLGDAKSLGDLGTDFGHTITERELSWSIHHEWTRSAQDYLWRRTKLGLRVSQAEADQIEAYISAQIAGHDSSDMPEVHQAT
ncbi:MAG: glycerol-3-phosphate dehydrogenase C-terminal domain-containing protein, partial [Pseudomonadota bacterium]